MFRVLAPVLIAATLGWLVLRLFFRPAGNWLAPAFYLALGFPVGAGLYGISAFLCFLAWRPGVAPVLAAFSIPAAIAACVGWRQSRGGRFQPMPLRAGAARPGPVMVILGILCLAACLAALLLLTENFVAAPHGLWDAHAMWNARARVLFRAPDAWRDVFLKDHPHPDYPLSLSILVFTGWRALGREAQIVPFAVATAFLLASAGIVAVGLTLWKNLAWGLAAASLILCGSGYVSLAGSQYADVPLSALLAASIVLFTLAYRQRSDHAGEANAPALLLAGAAAGLCAWIKNEGSLIALGFTFGLALGCILFRQARECFKQIAWFWTGAAPVLAILQYYRSLVPPNDIVLGVTRGGVMQKLTDAQRWETIAGRYAGALWHAPGTAVPLVLMVAFAWLVAGVRVEPRLRLPLTGGICALGSVAAGHFAAYVVTPNDLSWHLNTSVDRLALQLLPSFLFLAFLPIRREFLGGQPAEEAQAPAASETVAEPVLAGKRPPAPKKAARPKGSHS